MFGFNDHTTVRLLADDRYHTYRPAPRWSLRRSAPPGRRQRLPPPLVTALAPSTRPSSTDRDPARAPAASVYAPHAGHGTAPYHHGVLVGRTGLSPVMVGRAVELDRLAALVGARPAPAVALVSGEAGIGKTRLVQELVRRAPAGTLVLAGQADPGTVGRPMELFLDAVDAAALAGRGGGRRRRRDDGHRRAPTSQPWPPPCATPTARPRSACGRASTSCGRWATGPAATPRSSCSRTCTGPTPRASPRSSASPSRPPPGAPGAGRSLVLVGTYRPYALSRRHPAAEAVRRLERRHRVTHVHLDRLTPADVSGFLAAVFDQEPSYRTVDALHTRTGGNPFFLEELVSAAGEMPAADGDAPLPWSVSELVSAELDHLDPDVREMVRAAAVLGRRVPFDLLAAVTGASEADLIARLRVAVDRGLLVESDTDLFGFHHELAREAVQAGLLGRERRRLHEAALDALRAAHSRDHVALTHHAQGAGRFDDMLAEARLGARESLALGSSYQALQLAEMGLAEAPGDLDLLAVAARAAWLAGLLDDALGHAERWLALARQADDVGAEAEALALRTRVAFEGGDLDDHGHPHRRPDLGDRPPAHRRAAGPGHGRGGAVVHAPRPGRGHLRVGRQGAGPRRRRRPHRGPAVGDDREGLDADARPGPVGRGARSCSRTSRPRPSGPASTCWLPAP